MKDKRSKTENMPESFFDFAMSPENKELRAVVAQSAGEARSFLAKICGPAAEEFGLMLKEKMRFWRLSRMIRMLEFAKGKMEYVEGNLEIVNSKGSGVHPRVAMEILDSSSWVDDDELLQMWAGLLVSSAQDVAKDDSNIIYTSLLKTITSSQAKIINDACRNRVVKPDGSLVNKGNDLGSILVRRSRKELFLISGTEDVYRLEFEFSQLIAKNIFMTPSIPYGGYLLGEDDSKTVSFNPTAICLQLYARCNGAKNIIDLYESKL